MKKLSRSKQWFANNPGYEHFKAGNLILFNGIETRLDRVSIAKGKLKIKCKATDGYYFLDVLNPTTISVRNECDRPPGVYTIQVKKKEASIRQKTQRDPNYISKAEKWFRDKPGYDHFKQGNIISFNNKKYRIIRVSVVLQQYLNISCQDGETYKGDHYLHLQAMGTNEVSVRHGFGEKPGRFKLDRIDNEV